MQIDHENVKTWIIVDMSKCSYMRMQLQQNKLKIKYAV